MTPEKSQDLYADLEELLEQERCALLAGDLQRMTEILPQKEDLVEEVDRQEFFDPALLESVSAKLRRNQLLISGCLEGIRTVAARMEAVKRIQNSLETYGPDGKRHSVNMTSQRSVEKRA